MKKILFIALMLVSQYSNALEVNYRVTFKGSFTKINHPVTNFPSNPHFSPMIVASHSDHFSMFQIGATATDGIKDVAETGNPKKLLRELDELESNGVILESARANGISGNGIASTEITISDDYPLISVVTMIAPSPDWIIGVSGYTLIENGKFVNKRVVPLYAMDAGTDLGLMFTSQNRANRKRSFISQLINVSGISINNSFGTLIIEKL